MTLVAYKNNISVNKHSTQYFAIVLFNLNLKRKLKGKWKKNEKRWLTELPVSIIYVYCFSCLLVLSYTIIINLKSSRNFTNYLWKLSLFNVNDSSRFKLSSFVCKCLTQIIIIGKKHIFPNQISLLWCNVNKLINLSQ